MDDNEKRSQNLHNTQCAATLIDRLHEGSDAGVDPGRLSRIKNTIKLLEEDIVNSQPKKKIIDLASLRNVECEFSDHYDFCRVTFGRLINMNSELYHNADATDAFKYCRPRMNHKNVWEGGDKCPLPAGYIINIGHRDNVIVLSHTSNKHGRSWAHGIAGIAASEVIWYEVTGVEEGYCH